MDYNKLVFDLDLSKIDEEKTRTVCSNNASYNFSDLTNSLSLNENKQQELDSNQQLRNISPKQTMMKKIFMDAKIEETLINDTQTGQTTASPSWKIDKLEQQINTGDKQSAEQNFGKFEHESAFLESEERADKENASYNFSDLTDSIVKPQQTNTESVQHLGGVSSNPNQVQSAVKKIFMDARIEETLINDTRTGQTTASPSWKIDKLEQQVASLERKLAASAAETESLREEALRAGRKVEQLGQKLALAESEMDSFEEIEEKMIYENFQLKKELLMLKVRFELITVDDACKELGCCSNEFIGDH